MVGQNYPCTYATIYTTKNRAWKERYEKNQWHRKRLTLVAHLGIKYLYENYKP